ncbi:MAG: hypothetical protein ACRC20_00625 [Segniliparus sp.]|uniref:hypothetical protein n=1 Tax=Segniliparus sp. TaxID=2804064 RepID=UPI003F386C0D
MKVMAMVAKKAFAAAAALGAAALLGAAAPASAKTIGGASGYDVTYQVSGTQGANIARIRYQGSGGEGVTNAASLPWSYSFHVGGGSDGYNVPAAPVGVYVDSPAGASASPSGLYTCEIFVNGQLMETRTRDTGHVAICVTHDD